MAFSPKTSKSDRSRQPRNLHEHPHFIDGSLEPGADRTPHPTPQPVSLPPAPHPHMQTRAVRMQQPQAAHQARQPWLAAAAQCRAVAAAAQPQSPAWARPALLSAAAAGAASLLLLGGGEPAWAAARQPPVSNEAGRCEISALDKFAGAALLLKAPISDWVECGALIIYLTCLQTPALPFRSRQAAVT